MSTSLAQDEAASAAKNNSTVNRTRKTDVGRKKQKEAARLQPFETDPCMCPLLIVA